MAYAKRSDACRRGAGVRLFACLLRREITPRYLLALVAVAFVGGAAAANAMTAGPAGPADPLTRIVRRFDLIALAAAGMLAVVRVAARLGDDHARGWLVPWFGAYGGRGRYALGVAAAVACGAGLLLLAGALPFSVVTALMGEPGFLRDLPRLLAGGTLLVGAVAAHTALIGVFARSPSATILAAGTTAAAPYLVAATYLPALGTAAPPAWLRAWLVAAPPLAPARDAADALHQLAFVAAIAVALTLAARLRAGRRA